MNTETQQAILDALDDDGDTFKFDDGRVLTLKIEPDDMPFLFQDRHGQLQCNEDGFYGQFAWADDRRLENAYGHHVRPPDFTGNAEKLCVNRGDPLWWEPPSGDYTLHDPDTGKPARRGSRAFEDFRHQVLDMLEFGYSLVGITLTHSCPGCGDKHVENSAWLGGIDPSSIDYRYRHGEGREWWRETLSDLLSEIEAVEEVNA